MAGHRCCLSEMLIESENIENASYGSDKFINGFRTSSCFKNSKNKFGQWSELFLTHCSVDTSILRRCRLLTGEFFVLALVNQGLV